MNNFDFEFEITLPNGETTYQYNNSPKLTNDFIDFLEEVGVDIHSCVYKVTNINLKK